MNEDNVNWDELGQGLENMGSALKFAKEATKR